MASNGRLYNASGIAFDSTGTGYVSEWRTHKVRRFSPALPDAATMKARGQRRRQLPSGTNDGSCVAMSVTY